MGQTMPEQVPEVMNPARPIWIRNTDVPLVAGVSERQLRYWVAEGRLRVYRPQRKMGLIRLDDLRRLIECEQTVEAAATA